MDKDISNWLDDEMIENLDFYNESKDLYDLLLKDITPIDFMNLGYSIKSLLTDSLLDDIKRSIPYEWLNGV